MPVTRADVRRIARDDKKRRKMAIKHMLRRRQDVEKPPPVPGIQPRMSMVTKAVKAVIYEWQHESN